MQGADVNSTTDYDGRTALHVACVEGNSEAVKFLLKHGASTQVRDRFNTSPLDDAIKFRHKEIVKTLRKAGAKLMKTSMETAVELCRLAAKNRVDDLLVWQLAGVDLNACDYDKRTPLHVVSVAREILISRVALVISDTSRERDSPHGEKRLFCKPLKGHSQQAHVRIRYHFIANLHITETSSILFLTKYDKVIS